MGVTMANMFFSAREGTSTLGLVSVSVRTRLPESNTDKRQDKRSEKCHYAVMGNKPDSSRRSFCSLLDGRKSAQR